MSPWVTAPLSTAISMSWIRITTNWGFRASGKPTTEGSSSCDHVAPAEIIGSRLFVRPFTFVEGDTLLKKLSTGLTFVTDIHAPLSIEAGVDGRTLNVASSGKTLFYGWILTGRFRTGPIRMGPLLRLYGNGWLRSGSSCGHFVNFYLTNLTINGQFEWRYATAGINRAISAACMKSRSGASSERWDARPQAPAGSGNPRRKDRHGLYAGLDFTVGNSLSIGGTYEEFEDPTTATSFSDC